MVWLSAWADVLWVLGMLAFGVDVVLPHSWFKSSSFRSKPTLTIIESRGVLSYLTRFRSSSFRSKPTRTVTGTYDYCSATRKWSAESGSAPPLNPDPDSNRNVNLTRRLYEKSEAAAHEYQARRVTRVRVLRCRNGSLCRGPHRECTN